MAGKVCPILSREGEAHHCIGGECMMFLQTASSGACAFVKGPQSLASRLDTLSAQVQEMQVALIKLTNA